MTVKDKKEILQIFTEAFEKTAMPVLRRMQDDIRSLDKRIGVLEKKVDNLDKRIGVLEKKVDNLDKRIGVLEKKVDNLDKRVGILEQKMDAYTGEVIIMHKEISASLNGWRAHGDELEKHAARIRALEMGYARPSL